MECPICGQSYDVSHDCPEAEEPSAEEIASPPAGFAPLHYFLEAIRVVRLDEDAIERISLDRRTLPYGVLFLFLALSIVGLNSVLPLIMAGRLNWAAYISRFMILFPFSLIMALAQFGVCHLLARGVFGGTGSAMGVIRPMLFGSIVQGLLVFPRVGPLAASLWSLAILLLVLEVVDEIGRLKAFGISLAVVAAFLVMRRYLIALG